MQHRPEPHIAGHPAPTVTTTKTPFEAATTDRWPDEQSWSPAAAAAGGGSGGAIALRPAETGATVALTGRDRARTQDAADEIRTATGVHAFTADLSAQTQVRRLAAEVLYTLPRIDMLVNRTIAARNA